MQSETDKAKLQRFMAALGAHVRGDRTVYLTGGGHGTLVRLAQVDDRRGSQGGPRTRGFFRGHRHAQG